MGGALIVPGVGTLLKSCSGGSDQIGNKMFTNAQKQTMEALVDTFIPDSEVFGAVKAGVASFISMMIVECYTEETQNLFKEGLFRLDEVADNLYKTSFKNLELDRREQALRETANDSLSRFFQLAFELTYLGYFTSEIGATQVLEYVHIPGRYEPCETMKSKQPAWAL